ncbi:MAG: nucleotidyltransferase domain-containing protein [Bdellovibrionota bacterium]
MNESKTGGLSQSVVDSLKAVFSRHPNIKKIILYGSRAKGNYKPGSDVDLTLVAPKMALTELLKIENEIDELLLPYKVDLSLFHKIENSDLIDHIQRVGVEL